MVVSIANRRSRLVFIISYFGIYGFDANDGASLVGIILKLVAVDRNPIKISCAERVHAREPDRRYTDDVGRCIDLIEVLASRHPGATMPSLLRYARPQHPVRSLPAFRDCAPVTSIFIQDTWRERAPCRLATDNFAFPVAPDADRGNTSSLRVCCARRRVGRPLGKARLMNRSQASRSRL